MTFDEFMEIDEPFPKDTQELIGYLEKLIKDLNSSYSEAPFAPALAAISAFNYVACKMGLTGFQASHSGMLFLAKLRHMEHGFKIIDYRDLLYPQYLDRFNISADKLIRENLGTLKSSAKDLLTTHKDAAPEVKEHWKSILDIPDNEEIIEG